jgi:hypothetical protein
MTDGQLLVGQSAADPAPTSVTGDVTISALGVTAIGTAKVTYAMMQNVAALSVIGRSANSSGVSAAISCVAASDAVLRESGSVLGCGTVATAGIANNAVTFAKFQQIAALSMFGNCTNGTADGTAVAGIADQVLRVNGAGTSCAFGAIDLSKAAAATGVIQTASVPAFAGGDVTSAGGSLTLTIGATKVTSAMLNADVFSTAHSWSGVQMLASPVMTGTPDIQQALALSGDISPTQIAAATNDYAPTGFSTASTLRISTDASRNITGLAAGSDGRVIIIHNVGSFDAVLTNEDAGSTAGNRFLFGGDMTLATNTSVTLRYDATSSRWRAITSPGSGGGGGGTVTSVTVAAGAGLAVSGTVPITSSGTVTVAVDGQFGFRNRIINPSGHIWQRQNTGAAAITDDVYAFDRWYGLTQTAGVTASQVLLAEDGTPDMMRLTQANASAQRFGIAQIIEFHNSVDLRSQNVVLSARVRMSATTTLRYAILGWTGTADTVTSDWVLDWTNGTFTAGNFFTTTNTIVLATGSTALTANTLTTITALTAAVTGVNNVAVMFWTDSTQAQNVTLDIAKVQLEIGSTPTQLALRAFSDEVQLCRRFYEKSYDLSVAPGTNAAIGIEMKVVPSNTVAISQDFGSSSFTAPKVATPTVTIYGYAGGSGKVSTQSGSDLAASSGIAVGVSPSRFGVRNNSGGTLTTEGFVIIFQWVAVAEL